MKKSTTSERLREYMDMYNVKQVDILQMAKPFTLEHGVKLNKNDLSQYVSGKVEPGQEKVFILSKALNVDPAWVMGLDVPMRRDHTNTQYEIPEMFDDPGEAREYIDKHRMFGSSGLDTSKLDDEEIVRFANELLEQMKMVSYKYRK